jgi:branched-chain amino acid transport system ATP-binding protein
MEGEKLLQLEQISASYGRVQVLREVSLEVREGEIVTIIGPNGAGKTTLLRTISGLVTKTTGRIYFNGCEVSKIVPEKLPALGLAHVPEGRQLFPSLTVYENLQLGAYVRYRKQKASEIKSDFEFIFSLFPSLANRLKQVAGTLSGGEQQMLAIARALMAKPKLLLLDEPSMGLAPKIIQKIFATLAELRKKGVTILLVEQDAGVALKIADRGYVLQTGSIVMQDTGDALLANPEIKAIYFGKKA